MHGDSKRLVHHERVCKGCGESIARESRRNSYCSYDCYVRHRNLHVRPLLGDVRLRRQLKAPDTAPVTEATPGNEADDQVVDRRAEPARAQGRNPLPQDADDTAWAARGAHWEERVAKADKPGRGRVLILSGHGVALRLERGGLVVRSGFTYYPQRPVVERIFPTDRGKPSRIVILDSDGSISFDVLRWCERQAISVVWLDWHGAVSILTAGRLADAALIRAQVMMPPDEKLALAQGLVIQKIRACAKTLTALPPSPLVFVAIRVQEEALGALGGGAAESVETLRLFEGRAAKAYFGAWRTLALRWAGTRRHPIPNAWYAMDSRPSAITGTNQRATHPVNALLNYAYGVLEGEVRIAAEAAGLDPTIGVLHASRPGRLALVYDLMEPLRPMVDKAIIRLLTKETLHPADFPLQEDGSCRLHPEMAKNVASKVTVDCDPLVALFAGAVRARLTRA